jgi:hypothetical protein
MRWIGRAAPGVDRLDPGQAGATAGPVGRGTLVPATKWKFDAVTKYKTKHRRAISGNGFPGEAAYPPPN